MRRQHDVLLLLGVGATAYPQAQQQNGADSGEEGPRSGRENGEN